MTEPERVVMLNDRYELGEEIGRGGMGTVHRAHDTMLDRHVAVKLLSDSGLGTEGRERMLREAQAIAKLNHPNIVQVYDAGHLNGTPYIVMELVEGHSMHERPPRDLPEIVAVARQICAALKHAHQNGIIHRDLKPENVIVGPDGSAKLMDFGLARPVVSRMTTEGEITGTVFYLAPEIALGQDIDSRADLYSMGVMLYELVTGSLPFAHGDPLAVISQHLHASVVPPRAKNPEVPPILDHLIVQLLSKIPTDRPASASEVLERLAQEDILSVDAQAERELRVFDRIVRGRFVGREHELAEAKALWNKATRAEGQTLLISGEPGVGKTRLIRELATYVEVTGGRLVNGNCYAEAGPPYTPFSQMLHNALRSGKDERSRIPNFVLADLLNLAPDLRSYYPHIKPNPPLGPEAEQQRLFENVVAFWASWTQHAPLMMVVDDAHWADSGSLTLLRHLARRMRSYRFLLVASFRQVEVGEAHLFDEVLFDLNRERLAKRLELDRLGHEETRALLTAIFEGEIASDFLEGIYRETEGNPFFIEEVCKEVVEKGKLRYEDGNWHWPQIEELDIPKTVRVAIRSRVAKLPTEVQQVMQLAAILGREFDIAILSEASKLGEDPLDDALEKAEQAQLIEEIRREGEVRFSFAHGLIPTTLVEEMPPLRRRKLHRLAAVAIESLRPAEYEELAHHYAEAGQEPQANLYLTKAAERASQANANQEAISYLETALEMADRLPDLRPEARARLHGQLADVFTGINRYPEAITELERGIGLVPSGVRSKAEGLVLAQLLQKKGQVLRSKGDYDAAIAAIEQGLDALPEGQLGGRGALKIALASVLARQGQLAEAQRWCEAGMEDVKLSRNQPELAHAYSLLGTIRRDLGDTQASLAHRMTSLEISETLGDIPLQIEAHNNLAVAHYDLGRMEEAIAHYERSHGLSEQVGNLNTTARAQINLGEVHLIRGEWDSAKRAFEQALEIWTRTGYRLGQAYGSADMGAVLVRLGNPNDALELLARSEAIFKELGGRGFLPMVYRFQAEAHLAGGRLADAEKLARTALELAQSLSALQEEGAALRVLGIIHRESGDLKEAEQCQLRSVKIFLDAGIQYEEARGLYQLAQVLYDRREFNTGVTKLERAIEQFQSVGAVFDLSIAQALREKLLS